MLVRGAPIIDPTPFETDWKAPETEFIFST
jgi:hypothetical protein